MAILALALPMKNYVALLHSIVLGGGMRVAMADLRETAEQAGFLRPRTLVATGNLVVEADENLSLGEVECRLEEGIVRTFGKHIDVVARTAEQWKALVSGNPFPSDSVLNASNVVVRIMRTPLSDDVLERLDQYRKDTERLALVDGDLWISFAGKPSESRLLSQLTTRRLGIGTFRNWNTVKGLADMLG